MELSAFGKITITTLRNMAENAGYDDVYKAPRSTWERVSSKKIQREFKLRCC